MRYAMVMAGALVLGACSMGADMSIGANAVTTFHKQLDAGQLSVIEDAAGAGVKTPPGRLVQLLDAVRRKLGRTKSAQQVGFNDQVNTGGHFLSLNYQTTFEKGVAEENFYFRIDGGKAVLEGYHVSSDALILN